MSLTLIPRSDKVRRSFLITAETKAQINHRHRNNGHDGLTIDVVSVIFLFQERKPIEPDHLIGNSIGSQEISNGFSDQKNNLEEETANLKNVRSSPEWS